MSAPNRFLLFGAFFGIYFIWGTTYLAALFGLDGMKPFVLCTLRYAIAGSILLGWSLFRGEKLRRDRAYLQTCAVSGILMLAGGTGLVIYAEQYVNSGEAAVIVATEPIFFLLFDYKRWRNYFSTPLILFGIMLGFGGVAMFSHYTEAPQHALKPGESQATGIILLLLAAVFWVLGALYAKNRLSKGSSNTMNSSMQLLFAAVFCSIVAVPSGEWRSFDPLHTSARAWAGLLFLVIMGSLVAYMAYTWLLTIRPPALISTHTYVNPVVAIIMGWLLAGEKVAAMQLVSLVVILAGVLLVNLPDYRAKRKPA
ncbi:MAG: EamA family transporter [Mucilaginibacter polytrichastri]|nr:EamA family transporter [Mucilaginibacter polytrichastri]